jgi:hypothetical protein
VIFDGGRDGDAARLRRATVASPIPAKLAESMGTVRDPAAPEIEQPHEVTRRVDDTTERTPAEAGQSASSAPLEPLVDDDSAQGRVAAMIRRARACMAAGNLGGAVLAADQAMAEAAKAPPPGLNDLIEPARPLFDQIFISYVGLLGRVPVRARADDDLAGAPLDGRTAALLSRIDGRLTLEQLFRASQIPPVEAVGIAAALLQAGIIRVL